MTATTIKVSSELRDRLNAAAHDEGLTTGSFVERLLELYLREQRFARLRESMAAMDEKAWAEYREEMKAWDATLTDGLDE
jgi:predicted transcriptional regulator